MPGNPLVRFDEGRVGRTTRCRFLSYSTETIFFSRRALKKHHAVACSRNGPKIRLIDAGKQKAQFMANITHELRTPLQGIMGL